MKMSKLLKQLLINLLLLSILTGTTNCSESSYFGSQFEKPTDEIVSGYGYGVEIHEVETKDKYFLVLHRIYKNHKGHEPNRNYPVLIPNVFLGSSADFVIAGPERSIAMQLSDDGYDVWLGNYRGNTYSRGHRDYKYNDNAYWNFSMHELGIRDLPAMINYILEKTGVDKFHYIGLSLSTTIFFIMASEVPKLQHNIQSTILMAPVANINHSTPFGSGSFKMLNTAMVISKGFYDGKFLTNKKKIRSLLKAVCDEYKKSKLKTLLCIKMFLYDAFGKDPVEFDEELLPLIFGHYPAGTSSKLVKHYSQSIKTDRFGQYDFGRKKNLKEYKSEYPPEYDLKKIKVPIVIMYAENDLLANPIDTTLLIHKLPNVKEVIKINSEYFNHIDFVYAKSVNKLVNIPLRRILSDADSKVEDIEMRRWKSI